MGLYQSSDALRSASSARIMNFLVELLAYFAKICQFKLHVRRLMGIKLELTRSKSFFSVIEIPQRIWIFGISKIMTVTVLGPFFDVTCKFAAFTTSMNALTYSSAN